MGNRNWSEEEVSLLKATYKKNTNEGLRKMFEKKGFNRSTYAIEQKARNLMLSKDDFNDYVPIAWIVRKTGAATHNVLKRAQRQGAARILKNNKTKYYVTVEFAEMITSEHQEMRRNADELTDWVSYRELADMIDVTYRTIVNAMTNKRTLLYKAFNGVEKRFVINDRKRAVFHPVQVKEAAFKYRKMRKNKPRKKI